MRRPRIVYLLLAVTAVGAPFLFVVAFWITRALGFHVPILYLVLGALLLTTIADVLIAIANERINMRADAKIGQLNEPVGEQAVVVDAFKSGGGASTGRVRVHGQVWSAHCNEGTLLEAGQVVKVTDRRGLTVVVASDTQNEGDADSGQDGIGQRLPG